MNLIKISSQNIASETIQTVNARELHSFLGSKQQFTNWIDERIKTYEFVEGLDFLISLLKSSGGRPAKDYHLTLDMAKELSMVERTAKGKLARRYFIEMEKLAKKQMSVEKKPRIKVAAEKPVRHLPTSGRTIRNRDDLSFTKRDSQGRMINWFVEGDGMGENWFYEIIDLARYSPTNAFDAIRFGCVGMVRFKETGHSKGFFDQLARWASAAILHYKELPKLPFEMPNLGIPPQQEITAIPVLRQNRLL